MGKVMSLMSRPLKRYNIENRAHKIISRDKPTPAPHHQPFEKQLKMMKEADPHFMEKHNTKDKKLDDRLKDVFLTSTTEVVEKSEPVNPDRPLPQRRTNSEEFEFGVYEPKDIPKGKCTLRQALKFIESHCTDPAKNTAADIAAKYNLDPETTSDVLKYFHMFKVYIPEAKSDGEKMKIPEFNWRKEEDNKKLE